MYYVNDVSFFGQRVLVRVDFNVPLDDSFQVTDDTRIRAAIPTIKKILHDGGSVVLMSHLGRPKKNFEEKYSLKHILPLLSKYVEAPIHFIDDCISEKGIQESKKIKPGEVVLLENLRFYKEEKKGEEIFASKLSQHGTIYVNDAFGSAHRRDASISTITHFFDMCVCGLLMQKELQNISKLTDNPSSPFIAIMGGAKVSDKIGLMSKLIEQVDVLIVGGGMSYTFSKACGGKIGNSLFEPDKVSTCLALLKKAEEMNKKILLPVDILCSDTFSNDGVLKNAAQGEIEDNMMGLDIGEKTQKLFSQQISLAKTILWNGPMGVFEFSNFSKGTEAVARAIVKATAKKGCFSLVGGGDSVAAIHKYKLADRVSYISTGGGALLEYMEGKELPGIAALSLPL